MPSPPPAYHIDQHLKKSECISRLLSTYLKVRAGDTLCNLLKKWFLDFHKLRWLDHVQNLLNLTQEHHLNKQINFSLKGVR